MGFFRRHLQLPAEPDPALPMSIEEARVLISLTRQAFAERGVETVYDGEGSLRSGHGAYGLYNLAVLCVQHPRRRWRRLTDRHVATVIAAEGADDADLDEMRPLLRIRVLADRHLKEPTDYGMRLSDDLVGLLAVDHPEHVRVFATTGDFAALGDFADLRQLALANLRRCRAERHEVVEVDEEDPTSEVHVLAGDFFTASRALVLDDVLRDELGVERPSHGVLFAVPNRSVLALHPLSGPGVVSALIFLIHLAHGEHESAPGALSPDVYFAQHGLVERITAAGESGSAVVTVEGRLAEAFTAVGAGQP